MLAISCSTRAQQTETLPNAESPFHLFVLAGQSNMAGRGSVEPQDATPDPRIWMLNMQGKWIPAVDPLHFDKPSAVGVGLGKTFAVDYADAHPGVRIGLIPCAVGGSPISAWTPGGYHAQTKSHPFDDTLDRVRIAIQAGTLKGILWHQGESDSSEKNAGAYERNLATLIDRLRAEFDSPNLPFVIGQLGLFPEKPWNEERRRVDAAHKRLAQLVGHAGFVNARGLGHRGDKTHFNSEGYRELGHRYYAAFARIADAPPAEIVSVRRIWDQAPHSAFTDLVRFNGYWFCVFREGQGHVSPDGALRVLRSLDGQQWESAALLTLPNADLRDAKITVTPRGELMLSGAAAQPQPADFKHQSYSWFSVDGVDWTEGIPVGDRDNWLWRVTWRGEKAFGIGYPTNNPRDLSVKLYSSDDGRSFEPIVDSLFSEGYSNESSMVFLENGLGYCLLRRDPKSGLSDTAQLGIALPPYVDWEWRDLGVRAGGPCMIALPDGRLIAAVRLYDGHTRTSLCWVDPEQATITEFLRLPSGGDTSYAGMVWHKDQLWVSYYSSHERQGNEFTSAIYLARVAIQ